MTTVWFVIPAAREAAFRAFYAGQRVRGKDARDVDEGIGVMIPNSDGSKMFTGSARVGPVRAVGISDGTIPWLEVYVQWPPPGGWESRV